MDPDQRTTIAAGLSETSAPGEMPDRWSLIELKTWLEGVRGLLIGAVEGTESELARMRRLESALAKYKALSPVVQRLTDIRSGIGERLGVFRNQDGEWAERITWVEDLGRSSAAREASAEAAAESRVEVPDEGPSEPSVSEFGAAPFPDKEQAAPLERKTIAAALSKTFSERTLLIFYSFVFAIILGAASLTYSIANHFHQLEIGELHKSISMLKDELSMSYSANKELTLKIADLSKDINEPEAGLSELKDKNNELQIALEAANSNLKQVGNDLQIMQATNLRMIAELNAQSSEISNNRIEMEKLWYLSEYLRARLKKSFILNPVWLKAGESTQFVEGQLTIGIHQSSSLSECSDVPVYISSNQAVSDSQSGIKQSSKTFCQKPGIPVIIKFGNTRYSVVLLASRESDTDTKAYLITAFKE